MNRSVLGIILGLVAVLVIGGLVIASNNKDDNNASTNTANTSQSQPQQEQTGTGGSQSDTNAPVSETASVDIKNFAFTPSTLTVKKGAVVTWTNQDSDKHDIAPDDESGAFQGSELLSKGESYTFTFDKVGTFTYHCTPHPFMKAKVVVVE